MTSHTTPNVPTLPEVPSVGVVGPGRLGSVLARALRAAGHEVDGPVGRDSVPAGEVILLCVPDAAIPAAAALVAGPGRLVGHTSGATALAALTPAARAGADTFSMHPLGTFAGGSTALEGMPCAVAASSARAEAAVERLARRLGMEPFALAEEGRPAYHAAASMASNLVLCLLGAADEMASAAGLAGASARALFAPLVRQSVDNWEALGAPAALTGPLTRGDEGTVARQRAAVLASHAELLPLFDVLVERARGLSAQRSPAAATRFAGHGLGPHGDAS